jgi:tetratricopeptide (TPR) repeat protein
LPNGQGISNLTACILRRQGRWDESIRNFERELQLDPRDAETLYDIADTYGRLRRYAEQKSTIDRGLTIEPNNLLKKAERAFVNVDWKADTLPLHQLIDEVRTTSPAAISKIGNLWLLCALAERDIAAARDALAAANDPLGDDVIHFPRPFVEGVIERMANDEHQAQLAFTASRVEQDKIVQSLPDYGPAWCVLGVIDAALGRTEEALKEGRRAVELLPVEKDSINGGHMIEYLAMIAAWVGQKDVAFEQLATSAQHPSDLSYGQLKLMPFWDPLRGDPRFEKILDSLAPREIVSK